MLNRRSHTVIRCQSERILFSVLARARVKFDRIFAEKSVQNVDRITGVPLRGL